MDNCLNYGSGSSGCDPCPVGFEGDGVTCTDIDEVIAMVVHLENSYITVVTCFVNLEIEGVDTTFIKMKKDKKSFN